MSIVSVTITNANATLSSTIHNVGAVVSSINLLPHSLVSVTRLKVSGVMSSTLNNNVVSSKATNKIHGITNTIINANATLSSASSSTLHATAAITDTEDTLSSIGTSTLHATAAITDAEDTLSSIASSILHGSLIPISVPEGSLDLSANTLSSTIAGVSQVSSSVTNTNTSFTSSSISKNPVSFSSTTAANTVVSNVAVKSAGTLNTTTSSHTSMSTVAVSSHISANITNDNSTVQSTVNVISTATSLTSIFTGTSTYINIKLLDINLVSFAVQNGNHGLSCTAGTIFPVQSSSTIEDHTAGVTLQNIPTFSSSLILDSFTSESTLSVYDIAFGGDIDALNTLPEIIKNVNMSYLVSASSWLGGVMGYEVISHDFPNTVFTSIGANGVTLTGNFIGELSPIFEYTIISESIKTPIEFGVAHTIDEVPLHAEITRVANDIVTKDYFMSIKATERDIDNKILSTRAAVIRIPVRNYFDSARDSLLHFYGKL